MSGRPQPPEPRFWMHANPRTGGDCWNWSGSCTAAGYGHLSINNRHVYAHRFAYEHLVGSIPAGLQIDHLCRNRRCVNPEHLEPVTQQENIRRGEGPKKTHCPKGHPYDEFNTGRGAHGRRRCLTCHREQERARRELADMKLWEGPK